MKKYMLILAVIVSVATSAIMSKAAVKAHDSTYYWYEVNSSGEIVSGSQAYGGDKETATYAEDNLPCMAGNDADCVRGFNNKITSFPTNATGDTTPLQKQ